MWLDSKVANDYIWINEKLFIEERNLYLDYNLRTNCWFQETQKWKEAS